MFRPIEIANEFISVAEEFGESLTPMKIQKLVYYAHGWNLALFDQPLIDETVEAWKFGPVIRSLWRKFAHYGMNPISGLDTEPSGSGIRGFLNLKAPRIDTNSCSNNEEKSLAKQLVRRIWDVYGKYSAIQLSNMTHEEDSPWHKTWTPMKDSPVKGTDIPNSLIKEYFRDQCA